MQKLQKFGFFVSVSVLVRNIKTEEKIEKTKSKKIGRLRKECRENSKFHKSFLFRISLNKKRQQEAVANRVKIQTSSLI